MRDTILHVPLFAAFAAIIAALFWLLPFALAAALAGCTVGFIRELTQAQARTDNNILTCWDVWNWSSSKLTETFVPMVVICVLAFAIMERAT